MASRRRRLLAVAYVGSTGNSFVALEDDNESPSILLTDDGQSFIVKSYLIPTFDCFPIRTDGSQIDPSIWYQWLTPEEYGQRECTW